MEQTYTYYNRDGVSRKFVTNSDKPFQVNVYTEVEMDEVLESIKREREAPVVAKSNNKLLARVPLTVYEKSIHEQWDEGDWKKWLNDSDNAAFRIWGGRV